MTYRGKWFIPLLFSFPVILLTLGFTFPGSEKLNVPKQNISEQNQRSLFEIITEELSDSTDKAASDTTQILDTTFSEAAARRLAGQIDTTIVDSMKIDSTARLKFFRYNREDKPYVAIEQKKKSSFFAYPSSQNYKRTVELDSTGQYVFIKEKVADSYDKIYLKLELDEYIKMKLDAQKREMWEKKGYEYELNTDQNDLGQFISDITNIEIPLPSAGFLSIFGPNIIRLRINGSVDIHGAWRNETTEGLTASRLGNTRNEPDFSQQVQISVNGTIGDKLKINADWNTERTFEYENQLKIVYDGYEDEIVKKVEAGNVSLQTSPLVGGSEALFGIKSQFQFGPFSLTALASQKKGEVKEVNVSGGSEKQTFEIHAYDYSENHYFLDTIYASSRADLNFFNRYYGSAVFSPTDQTEFWRIKDIEVWKSTTGIVDKSKERQANAYIRFPDGGRRPVDKIPLDSDLRDSTKQSAPGIQEIGTRFIPLQKDIDYSLQEYVGFISFRTQIQPTDVIAAAYRIEGPSSSSEDDLVFGEFIDEIPDSALIVLKLIKPQNLVPAYREAWKLQLRNIYPVGGRDIKEEGFTLDILFRKEGEEPRNDYDGAKLLPIFGLDKTDASGSSANPDGAFDFVPGRTVLPITGEIIFPVLEPFGKFIVESSLPDDLEYRTVYDTSKTFARQDNEKDKFLISGEYSASVTSVYNIGFNVVENSVRVQLNGRDLKEGPDYVVDYNIGQITIRNDAALVPGADLKISYEQNDLFSLASKTLLGLRGIYEFDKTTKLGFSFLNLNQKTLSDKVRIGEEPLNNTIYGVDFESDIDLPFITKALDNLISTRANSALSVKGEFAYMSPDPNTKKSTISSDNEESIAYIDDFEGAKRTIPVGINYTGWKDLSPPFVGTAAELETYMSTKAKTFWFNILPSDVDVNAIWPEKAVSRKEQQVTVLDFVFRPGERGMYNNFPDIDANYAANWGGMMRPLSSTASNLIEENIEFIEFWFLPKEVPANAKLYIDIGKISEDVIPNGKLDTEDPDNNDNLEDESQDRGIDYISDANEDGSESVTDKAGDNFRIVPGSQIVDDYRNINGTEGNAQLTDIGRFPDSEDLNRNFTLDRLDSYFRYEISLDTSFANPYRVGGGGRKGAWYQFRIPVREFTEAIGDPDLQIIEFFRIWAIGLTEELHLRFAELNFVGNQWQKNLKIPGVDENDEVLSISTINLEDNPEYDSPPGVKRERDRSKPDEEVFKNEQSLQIKIEQLEDSTYREAVKYLFRPLDLFDYKQMKMFIRGDENFIVPGNISHYIDSTDYASEVYFRFGSDETNYYEYRQPLKFNESEGAKGWDEIAIVFDALTAIKEKRSQDTSAAVFLDPVPGKPGHFYGISGNPSLTRVTYFTVGIYNPPDKGTPLEAVSGEFWINELRVLGADDTPGWAYSVSTSLKVADLLNVSFNTRKTDPYFHKLNDRFGDRIDKESWSINSNIDLMKLIPADMEGSNLKLTYSHSENFSSPLYKPGTDILVEAAAEAAANPDSVRKEAQNVSIKDTWTLSNIRIRIPTEAWYINETINNLTFGFTYNKSFTRTPTVLNNKSWVWDAKADYSLTFGKENYFLPADIPFIGDLISLFDDYKNTKIFFTPQNFSTNLSAKRNWSFTQSRTIGRQPDIQRDFTAARGLSFNWNITEGGFLNLGFDYNLNITSSLTHLLTENDRERSEAEIWNEIFSGNFFGKDNNYQQQFTFKTNPSLPSFLNLNRFFKVNFGYRVTYNWKNNFQQEELGKSASYNSSLNAGVNIRLQSIMDQMLGDDAKETAQKTTTINRRAQPRRAERRQNENEQVKDEEEKTEEDGPAPTDSTAAAEDGESGIMKALGTIKLGLKYLLFDYEQIAVNFTSSNQYGGAGLLSEGTGFSNFWGIRQSDVDGPGRLFQLGLSNELGRRAPGGTMQDKFSQKNKLTFKTSRPLWENAKIDINWDLDWSYNKSTTLRTDSLTGDITITNVASTGNVDRTFFSMPLPFFGSDLKKVNELYNPNAEDQNRNLANAFVEGLESFPLLSSIPILKDVAKYVPRPNWRFSWSGLEKLPILDGIAKRARLDHAYSSTFIEGWKVNVDGKKEIQSQKISYGFTPLIGLDLTFAELWGGDLSANAKYNVKTNYDLGVATKNVTESLSRDISITASFKKSGFEIPLFGLSLKNDIEISFSYSLGKNSVIIYELGENFTEEGKPQDGTTRTTMEPRIRYVMSSRVTLSLFYKRTSVEPEGASRIPPTTTNEAGLDVNISIQ
ncbi:MAG: cell surface protein SprA [Melioribacteraceae bacterium]|nr:cell surface protein SprA [Melioribacteraceae bacterium]